MKLVAMTTRLCRTSVPFTGEDWMEERSSSVEGIWGHQSRVSEVPIQTIIRLRPGSTTNNTETELRKVLKLNHHKDVAPLPPFEPGHARRGGRNVKIHHQDAERKIRNQRTPYCAQRTKGNRASPDHNLQQAEGQLVELISNWRRTTCRTDLGNVTAELEV